MTRSELIARLLTHNTGLNSNQAEKTIEIVLQEIVNALSTGNRVELRGFGVFSLRERKARIGRNPRTGDLVKVPEKNVPFFKAGKLLRDRLNG